MNTYFLKSAGKACFLSAALLCLSACYYQPYPPPPPPVAVAPAPYYGCCYAYPEYPAYYGPAYYGPNVGVGISFGRGGWGGGRGWR